MRRFSSATMLIEALRQQQSLGCCEPAIRKLAKAASLKTYRPGTGLIIEGSDDNRIAFILSGSVSITIKGEKVAERKSGQHIGEMSVIDPSARRSATAKAIEQTTIAWIEEKDFSRIAASHPELWRHLACEISRRLKQRGALIRDKNKQPEIFIGSSTESVAAARAVYKALSVDPVTIRLWSKNVFGASEATMESLENAAAQVDFAVLILTADDKIKSRKTEVAKPRDNVVFELGLFMGAIGRKRTFILLDKRAAPQVPSDLKGITYLPFAMKNKKPITKDLDESISQIRTLISELNVR
jgi:CRP/FNR family cyclic AMP-dependent transcriptional regulator